VHPTEPLPERWKALSLCLVAGFMTLLDVSIVNVALPSMERSLHTSPSDLQWIVAGYTLAFGVVLVPLGRLGDARSRRGVFAAGLALFTVASAACGAAPDAFWLVVFRIVQGVGAGMLSPQVSGFIQTLFSGAERGRAFGLFGATVGVSTAVGPLLGGALVRFGGEDHGWRYVFLVNVPIGIAALLLVRRLLPAPPTRADRPRESLDPLGVLLLAFATVLLLLPLVQGDQSSLGGRPWWLAGVAVVLLGAFWAWERYWERRGRATVFDLSLLRLRSYVLGLALGTAYFAGFTSIFLVLTLYLQNGLGYDPLTAGLATVPFAVGGAVSSTIGGRLVSTYGRRLVVTGLVVVLASLVVLDLLVARIEGNEGLKIALPLLVAGLGGGCVISPNITITLSEVDPVRSGSGSGMLQTAQRVGSALGVAVVLAQFFAALASSDGDYAEALSTGLRTTIGLVVLALLLGLTDLLAGRSGRGRRTPAAPVSTPAPG
jgi:EmrB/QacA subfamily drug resistance transporter